jgi:hypothetical protein
MLAVNALKSGMRDDFSKYFKVIRPDQNILLNDLPIRASRRGNHDCIPRELSDRAYTYTSIYIKDRNFCDSLTGVSICFDQTRNHDAELLIHEQCGGGANGWRALEKLQLMPAIRNRVNNQLQKLPKTYTSIHVRHSDVKTDYPRFFQGIQSNIRSDVVVLCTDSLAVLEYAKSNLDASRIINLATIKANDGLPLHDREGITDRETNIDLLTDIFALSLARRMWIPAPEIGHPSGFATLAQQLMQRPQLICQLLGCIPKQLSYTIRR